MYSYYQGIEKNKVDIDPKTIGIKRDLRAISIPKKYEGLKNKTKLAEHVANLGLEALSGKKGMFYDGLLYSASLILWHLNIESSLSSASEKVRSTLDSANTVERL